MNVQVAWLSANEVFFGKACSTRVLAMLRYEVRFPRCGFTVIRNDTSLEVLSGPEEERVLWPAEALRVCLVN